MKKSNTTTHRNSITKLNKDEVMAGSVFFGSAEMILDDNKRIKFTVSSHLQKGKEYEFRSISKAKAGFNTISDFKCKAEHLWGYIGKTTQCVQVKETHKYGVTWFHVYITKAGIWETVDVLLLDTCTVGHIRECAPKNASYKTWNEVGAKTWADLAFVKK
jgi:hypothetical protein